ncbi:MAG: DUF4040 domain-containing protein [Rhodospirillaceae bacterium]|nr:DUF4040 domain-containing protein [Rhodospirillaceae bacterium]
MITATNLALLAFMAITAWAIARTRNLFVATMLAGIYSLLIATVFVLLDAVDVAFTEAAVGAGITTVLFLGALLLTDRQAKPHKHRFGTYGPMLLVVLLGAALVYTTLDPLMPHFGDAGAPAQGRLAPEFLADSVRQVGRDAPTATHIPNVVTTTLAGYRGFDTLGEVVVIFTAGVGVLILLGGGASGGRRRRSRRRDGDDASGRGSTAGGAGA